MSRSQSHWVASGEATVTLPVVYGEDDEMEVARAFLGDTADGVPARKSAGGRSNVGIATGNSRQIVGEVKTTFTGPVQSVTNYVTKNYSTGEPEDPRRARNRRILEWLSPLPQTEFLDAELEKQLEGTGGWFLKSDAYLSWLKDPASRLWVNGGVGSGKTVLCAAVIKDLQDRYQAPRSELSPWRCTLHPLLRARFLSRGSGPAAAHGVFICYFFFSFRDGGMQSLFQLLKSALGQLSSLSAIPAPLERLYDQCHEKYPPSKPSRRQIRNAVLETVSNFCTGRGNSEHVTNSVSRGVYLVVDALDEIPDGERELVVGFLQRLAQQNLPGLHLLCTSRDHASILQGLSRPMQWPRLYMDQGAIMRDIEKFVQHELDASPSLSPLSKEAKELIVDKLAKKGEGMFRLAALHIDTLKLLPLKGIDDLRRKLLNLPMNLNETYCNLLKAMEASAMPMALGALEWIIAAKRPLFLEEVIDAAQIRPRTPLVCDCHTNRPNTFDLVHLLRGLVTLKPPVDDYNNVSLKRHRVSIAHFSVQEYLTSKEIKTSPAKEFALSVANADENVALGCLVYLFHYNRVTLQPTYAKYPLLQYAWFNWEKHDKEFIEDSSGARGTAVRWLKELNDTRWPQDSRSTFRERIKWIPVELRTMLFDALNTAFFTDCYGSFVHQAGLTSRDILLPMPKDHIRLIGILPHLDPSHPADWRILCHSIEAAPKYTAISYTCGGVQRLRATSLSCFPIPSPPGLEFVLGGVTHVLFHAAEEVQVFWIDCLCTNLEDSEETGYQVPLIPEIFSKAIKAALYIRDPWSGDQSGILALKELATTCISQDARRAAEVLRALHVNGGLNDLLGLFEGGWWTRSWTIQEAVTSHGPILFYGLLSVSFSMIEQIMPLLGDIYAALDHPDASSPTSLRLRQHPGWCKAQAIWETRREYHAGRRSTLPHLLYRFRHATCSLNVDKVFSLLGMMRPNDPMVPMIDYSGSVKGVFVGIAYKIIVASKTLDVMAFSAVYGTGHPMFPSWVPNFCAQALNTIPLSAGCFKGIDYTTVYPATSAKDSSLEETQQHWGIVVAMRELWPWPRSRLEYASGAGLRPSLQHLLPWQDAPHLIDSKSELHISGLRLDYVDEVLWIYHEFITSVMKSKSLQASNTGLHQFLSRARIPGGETQTEALWRTLLANQWPDGTKLTSTQWHGCKVPPTTEEEELRLLSQPHLMEMMTFLPGRVLFRTRRGYFGLGLEAIFQGMWIVALCGGTLPFVLAPSKSMSERGPERFTVKGECYVHGLMDDEEMATVTTDDVKLFRLV